MRNHPYLCVLHKYEKVLALCFGIIGVITRLGKYEEAVAHLELAANMCPVRFVDISI